MDFVQNSVSVDDVIYLTEMIFGFKMLKVKPLVSYNDQNFLICPKAAYSNDREQSFIFKVLKVERSVVPSVHDQLSVMRFLNRRGFPCSEMMPSLEGNFITFKEFEEKKEKSSKSDDIVAAIVLVRYIPGLILSKLDPVPDYLFEDAGYLLAKMHTTLLDYKSNIDSLKHYVKFNPWSLSEVPNTFQDLSVVEDEDLRECIKNAILLFSKFVLPRLSDLPKGIIHGDFNDDNIIVEEIPAEMSPSSLQTKGDDEQSKFRIAGVIDFGEVSCSCFVFDVAIAISYMMINRLEQPLETGRLFLDGYKKLKLLNSLEEELLFKCIMGRLAQSIVLSLKDFKDNPSNDYYLAGVEESCDVLKVLSGLDEGSIRNQWFR